MSMGNSALLSGTDLLRLGEGFSGSAGDSELHRICAAARQAVSEGMRGDARRSRKLLRTALDGKRSEASAADTAGTG